MRSTTRIVSENQASQGRGNRVVIVEEGFGPPNRTQVQILGVEQGHAAHSAGDPLNTRVRITDTPSPGARVQLLAAGGAPAEPMDQREMLRRALRNQEHELEKLSAAVRSAERRYHDTQRTLELAELAELAELEGAEGAERTAPSSPRSSSTEGAELEGAERTAPSSPSSSATEGAELERNATEGAAELVELERNATDDADQKDG